ncbi:hypothetical protein SKAU_G00266450 [Synaphobranchus kaupii]|uniref:Uncharacterized protein n=1 Tax=Synaphobranchus kaupii TaxID=118154 RepID=A0A9Q1EZQ9_SYNKA|nr:hypothetical protein SKAU_G00266450 [Synaphobranchus kaupii]
MLLYTMMKTETTLLTTRTGNAIVVKCHETCAYPEIVLTLPAHRMRYEGSSLWRVP